MTAERTTKLRSVKNRPLLLYILLIFMQLSNHFFKQRPSETIGIEFVTEVFRIVCKSYEEKLSFRLRFSFRQKPSEPKILLDYAKGSLCLNGAVLSE